MQAAAATGSDSSSSGKPGLVQQLGQWLGLVEAQGKGVVRDVPPRQWRPVLHPAFTITGTQPTVVMPQVRLALGAARLAHNLLPHAPAGGHESVQTGQKRQTTPFLQQHTVPKARAAMSARRFKACRMGSSCCSPPIGTTCWFERHPFNG